jgi:hypothetical protein
MNTFCESRTALETGVRLTSQLSLECVKVNQIKCKMTLTEAAAAPSRVLLFETRRAEGTKAGKDVCV